MNAARYLAPLALVALCLLPPRAPAGVVIHRCAGPNGVTVFADRACDTMGLASRLPPRRVGGDRLAAAGGNPLDSRTTHRFGIGCPALDPGGMRSAVLAAIRSGDVNQLSGLYHWSGSSRGAAAQTLSEFRALQRREVLAVELESPQLAYASVAAPTGDAFADPAVARTQALAATAGALPALRIDQYAYAGGGPTYSTRFQLRRDEGCLWLAR